MRHMSQCLNSRLTEIIERASAVKTLQAKIIEHLPQILREHVSVGSFQQGLLVLVVHDSVWASQLRYYLPELRTILRSKAGLYQLASVKISVSADYQTPTTKLIRKYLPLSAKAREIIIAESDACEYEPLKRALSAFAHQDVV
jgi:hypothetical protein